MSLETCYTDESSNVLGNDEAVEISGYAGRRKPGSGQKLDHGGEIARPSRTEPSAWATVFGRCFAHTPSGFRARMNAPITRPLISRASTSESRPAPSSNAFASLNW